MTGEVAVLGTGAMGAGIAQRLADTGPGVRTWNRTAERARIDHPGITPAETPAQAVTGVRQVFLVLADKAALADVVDQLRPALEPGTLLLNLGTVGGGTIRHLASLLEEDGATLIDVGMLGNAAHARGGDLRLYVGGEEAVFETVTPLLERIGKEVRHVGGLGSGMSLKLALNLLMGLEMQALAEVVALGDEFGLDRSVVLESVRDSGFCAPVMAFKSRRMGARKYGAPDFRLALMTKDLGLAVSAVAARPSALPMTRAALASHQAAAAAGWADQDCAAIADALAGAVPTPAMTAAPARPAPSSGPSSGPSRPSGPPPGRGPR